jgi:L-iditol 2-dehydrogenase
VGADIFFECVGKNETVLQAIDLSAPSGRICMVGNPYSDMSLDKNVYWKILRNQLTVTGSWNSSFLHEKKDDWNYVVNQLEQGNIEPEKLISHRYDLEDLEQGLHIMRDKSEDYVKIMAVAR